jgi:hypothetical protein
MVSEPIEYIQMSATDRSAKDSTGPPVEVEERVRAALLGEMA